MNIKDKIVVCLTIISIILLGFIINSNADVMGQSNDKELAEYAKSNLEGFLTTTVDQSWFTQKLSGYYGSSPTIANSSATCLYETQGGTNGFEYQITNIIDIKWNEATNEYDLYGYWDGGNAKLNIVEGKQKEVDKFVQSIYNAYNVTYSRDTTAENDFVTTEKSAMKTLFYRAVSADGFLMDSNGDLNIEESFKQTENGEGTGYSNGTTLNGKPLTSGNLISQYEENVNVGYGVSKINTDTDVSKTKASDNNYTVFGPFEISFERPIETISINGDLKSYTDVNYGQIQWSYSGAEDAEWSNVLTDIENRKSFYIRISDSANEFWNSSNVTVTFKQKQIQTYQARIILLQDESAIGQNLMVYGADGKDFNASATYNVVPNTPVDLTVVKEGRDNVKQADVKFILTNGVAGQAHAHWGYKEVQNDGTMVYSDITFTHYTNEDNQVFTTGSNGKFIVKGLNTLDNYSLQETENPNEGYTTVNIRNATLSNDIASVERDVTDTYMEEQGEGYYNLITGIELSANKQNVLEVIDKGEGDLDIDIHKVLSTNTSNYLSGARFKIQVFEGSKSKGWLYYNENTKTYKYNKSYNASSTWNTTKSSSANSSYKDDIFAKSQGKLSINGLSSEYKYKLFEIKPATNCYNLAYQANSRMSVKIGSKTTKITRDRYSSENNGMVDCGTVSYDDNGSSVKVVVTNVKGGSDGDPVDTEYLKIDGKIWVDTRIGKGDNDNGTYDNLYNSQQEKLYKGSVTVTLMNSSGKVTSTKTSDGSYSLTNTGIEIKSSTKAEDIAKKLSGYYIKLEYNKKYTTVSPDFNKVEGSKALEKDNEEGVAYIYNLSQFVNTFYKYPTLDHMNMGLIGKEQAQFEVKQNIAYVKVVMNGYTYIYEYGGLEKDGYNSAPKISYVDKDIFTRAIYPSDIKYSDRHKWDDNSLKVFVVYRIDIINTEKATEDRNTIETPIEYVETSLQATELKNIYDTNRYELEKSVDNETTQDSDVKDDFGDWEGGNGTVYYKGDKLKQGIKPEENTTVYIQFKVKNEALEGLLDNKLIYEDSPTKAYVKGYHNYWKAYWTWRENNGTLQKVLKIKDDKTDETDQNSKSIYLKLDISTERTITGTVFEDENIYTNGEVLGDGKFGLNSNNKKENIVSGVTVELIAENDQNAYLYAKQANGQYEEKEAKTVSITDGTYSFVGVTPGKYFVRFTYGDGTQIIKETGEKESVTIDKYKSTIVTNPYAASALGYSDIAEYNYSDENKPLWYKDLDATNYSVATDNLEQRADYNENKTRKSIQSNTALMSITLENTDKESATITTSDNRTREKISGINFGIIDIPQISLASDKVVSNIQITNAQGNIIADGNPASKDVPYVSDLDEGNHLVKGSNYTKSEINENELYGSTLRVKYAITVQNNSQINYYEKDANEDDPYYGYYYKFGISNVPGVSEEETITIDTILDFLDPSMKYESVSDEYNVTEIKASDKQDIVNNIQNSTELTYDTILQINRKNKKGLYSTEHTDGGKYSDDKTQDTVEITAVRLLSANDDDLGVSNVAQVTELHVTDNPALIETIDSSKTYFNDDIFENPTGEVRVIITPPTGNDNITSIMYVVIGILSLVIISTGVIVIKKKVLRK